MARTTKNDMRNLTRRITMINDATSRSLLELVKAYEDAAEDQQAMTMISMQIDALDEQINDLEQLEHRTAKQEAKIKSLVKKVEALEKKLEGADTDCDMSSASVETILKHMIDYKHHHISQLEWSFNEAK